MLEDLTDFSVRQNGENGPTERENGVEYRRQGLRRSPQEPTPAPVNTREQAKKIPTDKGWDFEYWWWGGHRRQTAYEWLMRANVGRCGIAW